MEDILSIFFKSRKKGKKIGFSFNTISLFSIHLYKKTVSASFLVKKSFRRWKTTLHQTHCLHMVKLVLLVFFLVFLFRLKDLGLGCKYTLNLVDFQKHCLHKYTQLQKRNVKDLEQNFQLKLVGHLRMPLSEIFHLFNNKALWDECRCWGQTLLKFN